MEHKHTQGPWAHRNGRIFAADRENLTIANVARSADGDYSPANARLIAAAPELLEALIKLSNAYAFIKPPGYPKSDAELLANAAIAKATGA